MCSLILLIALGVVAGYFNKDRLIVSLVGGVLYAFYIEYMFLTNPLLLMFSILSFGTVPVFTGVIAFLIAAFIVYVSHWITSKLTGRSEQD